VELRESELDGYSEFIAIARKEGAGQEQRGVDVVVPIYNARAPEWLQELTDRLPPLSSSVRDAANDPRSSRAREGDWTSPQALQASTAAVARYSQRQPAWREMLQPMIERVHPWVPSPVRALGKELLQRLADRPLFALDGEEKVATSGLRLLKRRGATATYEAQTADPQLLFAVRVPSDRVNELRFRMRRSTDGVAHAQLFWAPEGESGFSEDRSALVQLDGPTGEWREYRLRLDSAGLAERWRCGTIAHLRFDPTDQPGVIELGRLELLG
jgi:hypothetical protein